MKLLIVLLSLIYFANCKRLFFHGRRHGGNLIPPPPPSGVKTLTSSEEYFDQILDHSDPNNQETFKQRYFVDEKYFDTENRSVAFLFIGGEGPASVGWMYTGSWVTNAEKYNALMFQLEHRYYGVSHPFNDTSVEHLKYLSSRQAIDDLATFIVAMNKKYQLAPDVKWIAFGGSYSGSLAAWLRQKYPHLVHGASSSSGPLEAIVDFQDYFRVVADDLRDLHSQECADVVQEGFRQLEASLVNDTETIDSLFDTCTPIKDSLEDANTIGNFMEMVADSFAGLAQYNQPSDTYNVNSVCDILTNSTSENELERLAKIALLMNGVGCFEYSWDLEIEEFKDETLDGSATSSGMRQWVYQTCTEFGFYQTSTGEPHVFGTKFPVDLSVNLCAAVYNSAMDLKFLDAVIDRTNTVFGAKNIQVSNVIFIHGTVDPWHPLGIYESTNPEAPAILINGSSHCADMYGTLPLEPAGLVPARQKVTEEIGKWLNQ